MRCSHKVLHKSMSSPFFLSLQNINEDNEVGNGEKSLEKCSKNELIARSSDFRMCR